MKKEQIKQLLAKSVLVQEASKQKILNKLETLSIEQIDALLALLTDAEEKQQALLKSVLEVHPDFLDVLENYTAKEIEKARIEAELKSDKEDANQEDKLLSQLEQI